MTANRPVSTVRLYSSMAENTMNPIGTSPNIAPWTNAAPAIWIGIPYTSHATRSAVTAPPAPAQLASHRRPTSR
jgi:hypothetical protein